VIAKIRFRTIPIVHNFVENLIRTVESIVLHFNVLTRCLVVFPSLLLEPAVDRKSEMTNKTEASIIKNIFYIQKKRKK
jgi:hypothetical protein